MNSSEIKDLITALHMAQSEMGKAKKDSTNPFYHSTYSDLTSVWDSCADVLTKYKLAISQTLKYDGDKTILVTTLYHTSGQWISSELPLILKDLSMQQLGSAITYARRYSLAAILGIVQEDDDAEGTKNKNGKPKQDATKPPAPKPEFKKTDERIPTIPQLLKKIDSIKDLDSIGTAYEYVNSIKSHYLPVDFKIILDAINAHEAELRRTPFNDATIPFEE